MYSIIHDCRFTSAPARFFHGRPIVPWLTFFSSCKFFFAPDSEAIGVITSSIGRVACLRFGAGFLVPLQGAAARCCCQSAVCILELGCWCSCRGAAAGCRCKVLLSECCLRFGAWLLVHCRVLLQSAVAGAVAVASFAGCCPGCRASFHFLSPRFQVQKGLGGLVCL